MAKDDRPGERKQEVERAGPRGGSVAWSAGTAPTPFAFVRRFVEDIDRLFGDLGFGSLDPRIEIQEGTGVPNRGSGTSAKTA